MSKAVDTNVTARRNAMAVLSRATRQELLDGLSSLGQHAHVEDLKSPECGLMMVRGRIGGDGSAFNVGEATVSRAVVRSASGAIGYGLRLGRDLESARLCAIHDAAWQSPDLRARIETAVLEPVRKRLAQLADKAQREAAATKVNFFTMSREAP
jgi:alpha-D-ribose 1-methylphosphonate 5-triphosphate synthase subunit PhnG